MTHVLLIAAAAFQLYKARQQIRLMEEKAAANVVTEKLPARLDSAGEKMFAIGYCHVKKLDLSSF